MTTDRERRGSGVFLLCATVLVLLSMHSRVWGSSIRPPVDAAMVFAEPSSKVVYRQRTMSVAIQALDAQDLASWEATITFDPQRLVATGRFGLSGLLPADSDPIGPIYTEDTIIIGQRSDEAHTGDGRLAEIEFEPIAPGETKVRIRNVEFFRLDGSRQQIWQALPATVVIHPGQCDGDFVEPFGYIDGRDIAAMIPAWDSRQGEQGYSIIYDIDRDGRVTLADLIAVVRRWNTSCSASPEPTNDFAKEE